MLLITVWVLAFLTKVAALANCSRLFIADGSGLPYAFKYVTSQSLNYTDSNAYCTQTFSSSSNLAICRSPETTLALYNVFSNFGSLGTKTGAFIGLKQSNKSSEPSGNWFWMDGIPCERNVTSDIRCFNATAFDNYANAQDCGTISNWATFAGYIDDSQCDQRLNFFCEIARKTNYVFLNRLF
jgi:hypothetical protein